MAEDYTTATLLAKSKMTELSVDARLIPGETDGDFGDDFERFRWVAKVNEYQDHPLYTVTLTVYFKRIFDEREVTLETMLPHRKRVF